MQGAATMQKLDGIAPFFDGKLKVRFVPMQGRDFVEYTFVDARDVVLRPVEKSDVERYPERWAAYIAAKPEQAAVSGTPLTRLPGIDDSKAIMFGLNGVNTIEHLANLDGFAASALGDGGTMWRDIAKLYLNANSSPMMAAVAPPEPAAEADTATAAMQAQIAEQIAAARARDAAKTGKKAA